MSAQNASGYDDWQPADAIWDDGAHYTGIAEIAPRRGFLQRIWSGRPMIYVLAAGLIGVTALVLATRPDAEPTAAAPTPAAAAETRTLIIYDAGPVIENELNKP